MREQHVERPRLDEPAHQADVAPGDADDARETFVLEPLQLTDRALRRHRLVERDGELGVVEEQQLDAVEAEPLQALLERLPDTGGAERAVGATIDLRRQHEAGRQPARLGEGRADSSFTLTTAVAVRRVEERDRPGENAPHGGDALVGVDRASEVLRHAAERPAAGADRRHDESGRAEWA